MHATPDHHDHPHPGFQPGSAVRDAGGYAIFSTGDLGAVHAMAHRMYDEGRIEEGHRRLGAWLEGRRGSGSDWVHIQFHMAVFEIELGLVGAAYDRFTEHVLPAAAATSEALTDAPALAWRLALASGAPGPVTWEPIRLRAVTRLDRTDDPYVDLHNALALAGAGDLENLGLWFESRNSRARTTVERLVLVAARALIAYAEGDFRTASERLSEILPQIPLIGGSRAQNRLFARIELAARRQIASDLGLDVLAEAA